MSTNAEPAPRPRPYIEELPDRSRRIHLKYGAKIGSQERLDFLTMQPAKGKHMRGMRFQKAPDGSVTFEAALMLDFAAKLCGVPPNVIDELEGEDLSLVLDQAGDFFASGQGTGQS